MAKNYFLHQIRGHEGEIDNKGVVANEIFDDAKQGYHAYLSAYGYNHDQNTDFVSCMITDRYNNVLMTEAWSKPEPEPNA